MKRCPKCGHLDFDDANFCGQDGIALAFYQEDSPELVKIKEEQDEREFNEWVEEMVSLPEEEFLKRTKALFVCVEPTFIPKLEKLFNSLVYWRENGLPLMDEEPEQIASC